jgi:hypothetical protein
MRALRFPSPPAGEGGSRRLTDEGYEDADKTFGLAPGLRTEFHPSSGPPGHLLPQGEKGGFA